MQKLLDEYKKVAMVEGSAEPPGPAHSHADTHKGGRPGSRRCCPPVGTTTTTRLLRAHFQARLFGLFSPVGAPMQYSPVACFQKAFSVFSGGIGVGVSGLKKNPSWKNMSCFSLLFFFLNIKDRAMRLYEKFSY